MCEISDELHILLSVYNMLDCIKYPRLDKMRDEPFHKLFLLFCELLSSIKHALFSKDTDQSGSVSMLKGRKARRGSLLDHPNLKRSLYETGVTFTHLIFFFFLKQHLFHVHSEICCAHSFGVRTHTDLSVIATSLWQLYHPSQLSIICPWTNTQ